MAKRLHPPPRFDKRLIDCQFAAALKAVNSHFNDYTKSRLWMGTVNPLLGNVVPLTMIKLGRFDKLMKFIYTQIKENQV